MAFFYHLRVFIKDLKQEHVGANLDDVVFMGSEFEDYLYLFVHCGFSLKSLVLWNHVQELLVTIVNYIEIYLGLLVIRDLLIGILLCLWVRINILLIVFHILLLLLLLRLSWLNTHPRPHLLLPFTRLIHRKLLIKNFLHNISWTLRGRLLLWAPTWRIIENITRIEFLLLAKLLLWRICIEDLLVVLLWRLLVLLLLLLMFLFKIFLIHFFWLPMLHLLLFDLFQVLLLIELFIVYVDILVFIVYILVLLTICWLFVLVSGLFIGNLLVLLLVYFIRTEVFIHIHLLKVLLVF